MPAIRARSCNELHAPRTKNKMQFLLLSNVKIIAESNRAAARQQQSWPLWVALTADTTPPPSTCPLTHAPSYVCVCGLALIVMSGVVEAAQLMSK